MSYDLCYDVCACIQKELGHKLYSHVRVCYDLCVCVCVCVRVSDEEENERNHDRFVSSNDISVLCSSSNRQQSQIVESDV